MSEKSTKQPHNIISYYSSQQSSVSYHTPYVYQVPSSPSPSIPSNLHSTQSPAFSYRPAPPNWAHSDDNISRSRHRSWGSREMVLFFCARRNICRREWARWRGEVGRLGLGAFWRRRRCRLTGRSLGVCRFGCSWLIWLEVILSFRFQSRRSRKYHHHLIHRFEVRYPWPCWCYLFQNFLIFINLPSQSSRINHKISHQNGQKLAYYSSCLSFFRYAQELFYQNHPVQILNILNFFYCYCYGLFAQQARSLQQQQLLQSDLDIVHYDLLQHSVIFYEWFALVLSVHYFQQAHHGRQPVSSAQDLPQNFSSPSLPYLFTASIDHNQDRLAQQPRLEVLRIMAILLTIIVFIILLSVSIRARTVLLSSFFLDSYIYYYRFHKFTQNNHGLQINHQFLQIRYFFVIPLLIGHFLIIFLPVHPLNSLQYRQKNPHSIQKAFKQKYQVILVEILLVWILRDTLILGSVLILTSSPEMKTPPSIAIARTAALASTVTPVSAFAPAWNVQTQASIFGEPFKQRSTWILQPTPNLKLIPKKDTGGGKGTQTLKLQSPFRSQALDQLNVMSFTQLNIQTDLLFPKRLQSNTPRNLRFLLSISEASILMPTLNFLPRIVLEKSYFWQVKIEVSRRSLLGWIFLIRSRFLQIGRGPSIGSIISKIGPMGFIGFCGTIGSTGTGGKTGAGTGVGKGVMISFGNFIFGGWQTFQWKSAVSTFSSLTWAAITEGTFGITSLISNTSSKNLIFFGSALLALIASPEKFVALNPPITFFKAP